MIGRSFAWLTGYRRLTLRYARSARLVTAWHADPANHGGKPGKDGEQGRRIAHARRWDLFDVVHG